MYLQDLAASSGNATAAAASHEALSLEILEAQVEYDVLLHGREVRSLPSVVRSVVDGDCNAARYQHRAACCVSLLVFPLL